MSEIRHFTDLKVWRKAHQLFLDILKDVESFPRSRGADAVAGQVLDSSSSISANISEGFFQSKNKFVNSLRIALGETNETENWLYKVRDAEFLSHDSAIGRLKQVTEIRKMLLSLKSKLQDRPNTVRDEEGTYELQIDQE